MIVIFAPVSEPTTSAAARKQRDFFDDALRLKWAMVSDELDNPEAADAAKLA